MPNSSPLHYAALCSQFPALPRTALIDSAFDYARDNMPDYLFNHVIPPRQSIDPSNALAGWYARRVGRRRRAKQNPIPTHRDVSTFRRVAITRSWIYSTRVADKNMIRYDAEVVAVSTLMHDIGLTSNGEGPNRFEVNGAIVTADFVRKLGFDDRRTQLVWDSIALHVTPSISLFKETEVALCARGIGVDFGTPDYGTFSKNGIDDIVAAVPRLNMVKQFTACCCHMAETHPETAYDNFMRDFGERYVGGYRAPSWVDRILGGPYSE